MARSGCTRVARRSLDGDAGEGEGEEGGEMEEKVELAACCTACGFPISCFGPCFYDEVLSRARLVTGDEDADARFFVGQARCANPACA